MRASVQQSVRKNYISIVNDVPANEQATDDVVRSHPGTKNLVGRLAAVLKRHLLGPPSSPSRHDDAATLRHRLPPRF